MLKLRPYQERAINELYSWMQENDGSPLVVVPTGGGKSLICAKVIEDVLTHWSDQRIIVVTHVQELVAQNYAELVGILPNAPAGIYSAGLGKKDKDSQILFCSIQSVYKHAFKLQKCDLIIVDEAHLIPSKDTGIYRQFIEDMRTINGRHLRVVGLTATPYRMDSGRLDRGDGKIFDAIASEIGILELIESGYLAPLISKATATKLDTTGVGTRGGEFIAGQLEKAVDIDAVTKAAVAEIVEFGKDRAGWLVFGSGIKHCEHICDFLRGHGISCEAVFGNTDKSERKRIIEEFKQKKIRCLVSVNVLSTGFNAKHVDLIALMRPTKSPGLYVQALGRGTRCIGANIEESDRNGKKDCIVLDFAGNIARFGPVDQIEIRNRVKGESGDAPTKTCPQCEERLHATVRTCPFCGYEFPPPEPKIEHTAADLPVLSTEARRFAPQWAEVESVSYRRHNKVGSPPSLKVTYDLANGLQSVSEWVALEHGGSAQSRARGWWKRRDTTGDPPPATVDDALARIGNLLSPSSIQISQGAKYMEVRAYKF